MGEAVNLGWEEGGIGAWGRGTLINFVIKMKRLKHQPKGWICKEYLGVWRSRWMSSVISKVLSTLILVGVSKNEEHTSTCNCLGPFQTRPQDWKLAHKTSSTSCSQVRLSLSLTHSKTGISCPLRWFVQLGWKKQKNDFYIGWSQITVKYIYLLSLTWMVLNPALKQERISKNLACPLPDQFWLVLTSL